MDFQENSTYSGCWFQMRGKVPLPGLFSCLCDFARCPLMFLSSLLPLTADLWQALPPAKFTFLSLVYKWCSFYRSWIFRAISWNDTFLHSSNISPSVQIWAPWTRSWDLKKQGTLPLELLWHFIKAIIRPLPSKDSLPQTFYMVSICTLIGNCLGWKKIFICLKLQLFPSTGKVQRALFPQPSPPRRNHKLAADLERWKSGAFGWYQLDQGRSTYRSALEEQCVCFCVAKDYLPLSLQQSPLCQLWLREHVFCIVSAR